MLRGKISLLSVLVAAATLIAAVFIFGGGERAKYGVYCPHADYAVADNPPAFPKETWQRIAEPAKLGWDKEQLTKAYELGRRAGMAAVFIVDDGRLVSSWGCTKQEWYVASVRKSFMNAVIGRHVADGKLSLDANLKELGIDEPSKPLSEAERRTPVRKLLSSSSGICRRAAAGSNCKPEQAAERKTPFIYNNWDFNSLIGAHQAAVDRDFFAFFEDKIARPIGMESFSAGDDGRYERVAESRYPAYVMHMSAEDMARFGLLYLNKGLWDGQQILPASWVRLSTQAQVATGSKSSASAYGFLWWVHGEASTRNFGLSAGSYSAEGNWLQAIFVIPARKTVIVVRGYIPQLYVFGRPRLDEMRAFFRALLESDRQP